MIKILCEKIFYHAPPPVGGADPTTGEGNRCSERPLQNAGRPRLADAIRGSTCCCRWCSAWADAGGQSTTGAGRCGSISRLFAGAGCRGAKFLGVRQRASQAGPERQAPPRRVQLAPVLRGEAFPRNWNRNPKSSGALPGHGHLHRRHVGGVRGPLHTVGWAFDSSVIRGGACWLPGGHRQLAGIMLVVQEDHRRAGRKAPKAKLQLSHNRRMLLQAVWVIGPSRPPCLPGLCQHPAAVFPSITIYYLQITGKYKPLKTPCGHVDISVEVTAPPRLRQPDPADKGGET